MMMRNGQHIWNISCIVILLLCLFPLAYLIFGVAYQSEFKIDKAWLAFFSHQQNKLLTSYFSTMSWLGSKYVLIPLGLLVLAVLIRGKWYIAAVFYSIGFAGASLLGTVLKVVLNRERPGLYPSLIDMPVNASFPSGHATQITAFSLCVIILVHYLWPKWQWAAGTVALVLSLLISISRLYLQVHYPTDVIGGILLAVFWVFIVYCLFQRRWPGFGVERRQGGD